MQLRTIETDRLTIGCAPSGPASGWPVVLLHGFPYDIHAFDAVAPVLADAGARVVVPYLRGFGTTTIRSAATPRSGEQAALGADLLALMDALDIESATLAGYDWGGRAACVVSALWPERVRGLVTAGGYKYYGLPAGRYRGLRAARHRCWPAGRVVGGAAGYDHVVGRQTELVVDEILTIPSLPELVKLLRAHIGPVRHAGACRARAAAWTESRSQRCAGSVSARGCQAMRYVIVPISGGASRMRVFDRSTKWLTSRAGKVSTSRVPGSVRGAMAWKGMISATSRGYPVRRGRGRWRAAGRR
jgi:pimeloyl-ACP methyl ester carboxylesterase